MFKFFFFFSSVGKLATYLKQKVCSSSLLEVLLLTDNFFMLLLGIVGDLTNALSVSRK